MYTELLVVSGRLAAVGDELAVTEGGVRGYFLAEGEEVAARDYLAVGVGDQAR